MTERDKQVEEFRDLTCFTEMFNHGFEHLAQVRGYSDEQFGKLEDAIYKLKPVPDELDGLLLNLGVLPV